MTIIGVDTGGTFTDFACVDRGRLSIHKVLSTPEAPERAILQGISELGLDGRADLHVVHGSTVATNAALEGKGVRTVYITNRGLGDLLTIGRQAREALYDLQPAPAPPPVPRDLCLETGGRLGADGGIVEELTAADLERLRNEICARSPRAVAINLLFSFLDDRFEREIEQCLPEGLFISRSSAVLPEYREYERGIATWLNAWLGPIVEGYLGRLRAGLGDTRVSVMQSSGGTIAAAQAGGHAVRMLLSGPAGGLAGARHIGEIAGRPRLLSFDMGGTSTDVALIDGEPLLTGEGRIGPWPVAVPMVDMHTIGAGGGSIARLDAGGMLQVGPESAGARPGPACYGFGGREPTVTDAHLALGRLLPDNFLGGRMRLDAGAARAALGALSRRLGIGVEEAAAGIVRIANEHMAQALRVKSIERGIDPRGCALTSFGGAGGLHVCALAEALGMTEAIVPVHAGVLSAVGMLVAPRERQLSRSLARLLEDVTEAEIEAGIGGLVAQGREELVREHVAPDSIAESPSLDLRYRGQSHALNLPWRGDRPALEAEFHLVHEQRYGHRLALPVELVTLRAGLRGPRPQSPLEARAAAAPAQPLHRVRMHGVDMEAPVFERAALASGQVLAGPALIIEETSTTFVPARWRCRADRFGNLLLTAGD
jgi:N-methylhydantoinase A